MSTEFHWYGLDIQFSAAGDDASASAILEINQLIVRELMTNPGDYIFAPEYGAGLGQYIGKALSSDKLSTLTAIITAIVLKQPAVQKTPGPTITFQSDATGILSTQILYIYAPSGQPVTVTAPPPSPTT